MALYDRAKNTATRLLGKYGRLVVITKNVAGNYNTATGDVTVTQTTHAAVGVLLEWAYGTQKNGDTNIPQTLIQQGDKLLYLNADFEPNVNDLVTVGTDIYTFIIIKPLAPAGTAILYECNVR